MTTHEVAEIGRRAVFAELERRGGADVTHYKVGRQIELRASKVERTRTVAIRVKTKTRGNWHASITEAASAGQQVDRQRFWVLVDLDASGGVAKFFVMPDDWIRRCLKDHYDWWLEIHGGERPVTPGSPPVAIEPEEVAQWQDAWGELGIF